MGCCKLCLQERPLVKSHILPEFLYAELYDSKTHKFNQLSTQKTKRNVRRSKGLYERMLCKECDNGIIGRYENYFWQFHQGGIDIRVTETPDGSQLSDVNYAMFKLFQVSLLWRCAVSTLEDFKATRVTANHAEGMRQMLYNGEPGESTDYGCVLVQPDHPEPIRDLIVPPEPVRVMGHRGFRMFACGLVWVYIVSRHAHLSICESCFSLRRGR